MELVSSIQLVEFQGNIAYVSKMVLFRYTGKKLSGALLLVYLRHKECSLLQQIWIYCLVVLQDLTRGCLQYPAIHYCLISSTVLCYFLFFAYVDSVSINCLESLTYDYFRSLLWVGPALLFSTATSISMLGWDGKVRTILSICMPNAGAHLKLVPNLAVIFTVEDPCVVCLTFFTSWLHNSFSEPRRMIFFFAVQC